MGTLFARLLEPMLMNTRTVLAFCALTTAVTVAAGCGATSSPASPSGAATAASSLDAFTGAWKSAASSSSSATPDRCSQLEYQVTKGPDGQSGTVQFKGTCAGITASGNGRGALAGTVLNWSAEGTASRGGVTCSFSFTNSTATREGESVRVTYSGSICGLPVSGLELLSR